MVEVFYEINAIYNQKSLIKKVMWRIDTLTPQEIEKYRQRSLRAINGIKFCIEHAAEIAQYKKIGDKYKTISKYIGLAQEGGNSYYNYFIPQNEDIVFLLRNGNHDNTNIELNIVYNYGTNDIFILNETQLKQSFNNQKVTYNSFINDEEFNQLYWVDINTDVDANHNEISERLSRNLISK